MRPLLIPEKEFCGLNWVGSDPLVVQRTSSDPIQDLLNLSGGQ